MSDTIRFGSVALECPDPSALARFYATITNGEVTFENEVWVTLDTPGGRIEFQRAPGHTAPSWPDPASSMQMHLDFVVDDLVATEARVVAAGATRFADQPNDDHCLVFADPAGHVFCLSTWADVQG